MAGIDMLLESAVKLILSRLPPETIARVDELAKSGLALKDQLDRIERKLDALLQQGQHHEPRSIGNIGHAEPNREGVENAR